MINSVSELYFRFRRFILLVQTKKVISIKYGSSTSCWKPWRWVRFGLIRWGIYTSIQPEPTHKIHKQQQKYNVSRYPMECLSNDPKDHPNQHKNSHKLRNEMGHSVLRLLESQYKLRQHDQNFPMEGTPL